MLAGTVTAVVPLKALHAAKGRLAATVDSDRRREIVAWMAERVLLACAGAGSVSAVLVVAGDAEAARLARGLGAPALVVAEPGLRAALDAADAVTAAAAATLVVAADLPLVVPADLDAVVAAAEGSERIVVVVPTLDGGTGALLRRPPDVVRTAYGPGSAEAHVRLAAAAGVPARRLEVAGLAADVDTPEQLRAALASAPGADVGSPPRRRQAPGAHRSGQRMAQGTVKYFDVTTGTGTVLLDNADELPIDRETFAQSGLLELRLGQRVRFDIAGEGEQRRVRALDLVSF